MRFEVLPFFNSILSFFKTIWALMSLFLYVDTSRFNIEDNIQIN